MPEPEAVLWGQGRRMTEMCGAIASVQLKKLASITGSMRDSKRRIKAGLTSVTFRKLHDESGDSGPFIILMVEDEEKAKKAVEKMREAGLHNAFRIADYGLHIYYNIPSLVNKVPLSPAGNPWNLKENA
jgi:8-amino-3,8-dideoxy-alpha-D-manno-octulosonate transaminase